MYSFAAKKPVLMLFCLIFTLGGFQVSGLDVPVGKITDDSLFRTSVMETWLAEVPGKVLSKPPVIHNLPGGGRIELKAETAGANEFVIILARELTFANSSSSGLFPGWAQGSWILTRRRDTGAPVRIRVFLRSDPNMYIQYNPFGADKCLMDVVVYDAYVVRSLPLPVTLERLLTMPVSDTLNLSGDKFPRRYFDPNPAQYSEQRQMIAAVRSRLPELEFADDGAINEAGRYVYIKTGFEQTEHPGLNCSGFSKWLIDGIVRPVTGTRLAIPPLKQPFGNRGNSFTEPWEELRDPFFGLDWIRNLASQAWSALRSPSFGNLNEIEVRCEPFSQMIARNNQVTSYKNYPGFLENAGYGTEGLMPLLYTLAIDEPGRFYLAAVNNEVGPPSTAANPRGRPRMRQYYHIAALIPYFNEYGVFQITVFESAAETSFNAFKNRYPGQCVNLVRVPIETTFDP